MLPSVADCVRLTDLGADLAGEGHGLAASIAFGGLVLGVCWRHRAIELDTPSVGRLRKITGDAAEDYSDLVSDELSEQGVSTGKFAAAGTLVILSIRGFLGLELREEAEELSVFTPPPEAEQSTSGKTSVSPSEEIQTSTGSSPTILESA